MMKIIQKFIDLKSRFLNKLHLFEGQLLSNHRVFELRERSAKIHPFLHRYFFHIFELTALVVVILLFFLLFVWRAPRPFPEHILVTIENGESLGQIAANFESEHVVRSSLWLKGLILLVGGHKGAIAGDYYLPKAVNVFDVAKIITRGNFGLSPIRVVIPEGLNSMEIADLLDASLPKFDKDEFIDIGRSNEGYLFPDTYFLMPNAKPKDVVALMRENFARKVYDLKDDIEKFKKPFQEVVIMASIVEDEARTIETRRIVAGILWKRLRLNMPLQADATFKYVNGKGTFDLTDEDLADKDNPYNTYANKGLPPSAISNPGLDSIRATLAPTNTGYLYFLSDKNGTMHYAIDFDGHKRNRELYLRKN